MRIERIPEYSGIVGDEIADQLSSKAVLER
jgi:hypothetical protein